MNDEDLQRMSAQIEKLQSAVGDVLVLSCPVPISDAVRYRLQDELVQRLPGRTVLVLDSGLQLMPLDQIGAVLRLERKVDALMRAVHGIAEALADGEAPAESRALDGSVWPSGERDQSKPL